MRRSIWTSFLAGALALGLLAVACGDDDSNPATPKTDGGTEGGSTTSSSSGGTSTSSSGGTSGGPDGGDAGCTFASHVIGLINNQTTNTSVPTADLGDLCTPSTSQTDFATLFP